MKLRPLYQKRTLILEPENPSELPVEANEKGSPRYGVIADLHIGFEEKFRGAGVRIEANAEKMLSELLQIVDEEKITDLIIAGDVKSGIDRILQSEWEMVPRFLSRLSKVCKVSIVAGNHDGGLSNLVPEGVELIDSNGLLISDSLILHGHTRPLVKFQDCKRIIMGHVHPIYQKKGSPLSGSPVWAFLKVRRKAIFRESLPVEEKNQDDKYISPLVEVVLLPSFNFELASTGYAFETARAERRVAPIVKELREADEALIITLDGDVIGDQSTIPNVL